MAAIFKSILNEMYCTVMQKSLHFVTNDAVDNISTLIQIERVKNTFMEWEEITGYLAKTKYYLRRENKANKIYIY